MHEGVHEPGQQDHEAMIKAQRERFAWAYAATVLLGVWLAASPVTLAYGGGLAVSDTITGVLIAVLGLLAFVRKLDFWARWGLSLAGVWLLFAPLVFWTDSAAAYANDTLIALFVIGFSVLAPMMPGKAHHEAMTAPGPELPPGWSYNPSSWWQRAPVIVLAFVSLLISRYLAGYQLEHIESVWDPFFGGGTAAVLTSDISMAWPIPDAGLGAVAYSLEMLSAFMGGFKRWRTMPWMVLMFGVLIVPLGITSIVLVMLQPVAVGEWCTLCLVTAAAMLIMIPLAIDEVAAMLQFMSQARREGQNMWRTFWAGGTLREVPAERDTRSPALHGPVRPMLPAAVWGVSLPWSLLAASAEGLWLMAAPDVLGSTGAAADADRILGPLVVVVAVTSMAEVVRRFRYTNLALGALLIAAAFLLPGHVTASTISTLISGVLVIGLSFPRGPVRERYGLLQRWVG
jgi:uncharacterized membrane protein